MNTKYVWLVLDEKEKVQSNWSTGTKVYTRKHNAENRCALLNSWEPERFRVVKYRLVEEAE